MLYLAAEALPGSHQCQSRPGREVEAGRSSCCLLRLNQLVRDRSHRGCLKASNRCYSRATGVFRNPATGARAELLSYSKPSNRFYGRAARPPAPLPTPTLNVLMCTCPAWSPSVALSTPPPISSSSWRALWCRSACLLYVQHILQHIRFCSMVAVPTKVIPWFDPGSHCGALLVGPADVCLVLLVWLQAHQ